LKRLNNAAAIFVMNSLRQSEIILFDGKKTGTLLYFDSERNKKNFFLMIKVDRIKLTSKNSEIDGAHAILCKTNLSFLEPFNKGI